MIIINACSKIKDLDLLKVINDYHTKNDNKNIIAECSYAKKVIENSKK